MTDFSKSQSLANRYRPQTFDEMIGQQHIIGILKAKMQSDSSSLQNYLLCGPRGTGKTTSARILAKAINCLNPHDGNPCNECANCKIINEGKTTDYVEIDAASNTGVDNVREVIIDQAGYQPISLKKKIYVIDEVHMLSTAAFNALLKTIEEPDGNVCFILATTELQKVPQTIISRVQVFNFRKVPLDEMSSHLAKICEKEGFEYEKEALNLIATISEGCVRDAVKYLDQVSVLGKISTENVSQFLGISTESTIKAFFDVVKTNNRNQIFDQIDLISQGTDLQQFAKQSIGYIDAHIMDNIDFYLGVSEAFAEILRQIRFYPYPVVLYKLAFNKYLSGDLGEVINHEVNKSEAKENIVKKEEKIKAEEPQRNNTPIKKEDATNSKPSEVRNNVINQIDSPTLKQVLKDHMTIEKVSDTEILIIHDNNMVATTMFEKDRKIIEELLDKELGKKLNICLEGMSKEEYFARLLG